MNPVINGICDLDRGVEFGTAGCAVKSGYVNVRFGFKYGDIGLYYFESRGFDFGCEV